MDIEEIIKSINHVYDGSMYRNAEPDKPKILYFINKQQETIKSDKVFMKELIDNIEIYENCNTCKWKDECDNPNGRCHMFELK